MLDVTARDQTLTKVLTYAGALPFIGGLIGLMTGFHDSLIVLAYGAVILSFLCGKHWAVYLLFKEKSPFNLLLRSNFAALVAWLSVVCPLPLLGYVLQGLLFLYLLWIDYRLAARGLWEAWYMRLRRGVTIVVCVCQFIAAAILATRYISL
jgi:Protein of unknown function (DUF3429)